jgi:hypothetical protein
MQVQITKKSLVECFGIVRKITEHISVQKKRMKLELLLCGFELPFTRLNFPLFNAVQEYIVTMNRFFKLGPELLLFGKDWYYTIQLIQIHCVPCFYTCFSQTSPGIHTRASLEKLIVLGLIAWELLTCF